MIMCQGPTASELDDITLWHLPAGRFQVTTPRRNPHHAPSRWLVVPRGGKVTLASAERQSTDRPLLLGSLPEHVVEVEGDAHAIEVPAYRLDISPLCEQPFHRYNSEQSHLIQAMLDELTLTTGLMDQTSQRYVAQAMANLLLYWDQPAIPPDSLLGQVDAAMYQSFQDSALRAEHIAQALGISRAGLYRLLSPYGGFKTSLHALRLDRVARLLRNPQHDSKPIKGLLFHNGFSSTEQFQRLFRQRFGVAARAFRKGERPTHATRLQLEALPDRGVRSSLSR